MLITPHIQVSRQLSPDHPWSHKTIARLIPYHMVGGLETETAPVARNGISDGVSWRTVPTADGPDNHTHEHPRSFLTALERRVRCYLTVAVLLVVDQILRVALSWLPFPSALVGAALLLAALLALPPAASARVMAFTEDGVNWVSPGSACCTAPLPPQSGPTTAAHKVS